MKKILLLGSFLMSFLTVKADEGMWLMTMIKRLRGVDFQKQGLKLTPEEIYSINQASLKDGIVSFGGFCTGEIVSEKGLILTNHHCGYDAIAALSSPEKDYLKNGFWAKRQNDELVSKDLFVRFLVRMGDATARINAQLNDEMSADERKKIIDAEYKAIQKENSENGKYTVVVRDFFGGNEFYYFVYQDFKDVRLVGAPPSALGKFGGDTDNWEWPRHTADFAMFRVYADAKGNPAEYSPTNVPLKPKHHLPISLKGVENGDFAMIIGYPGRTNRYLTSYGLEQLVNKSYPAWVKASNLAMTVMKKHMDKQKKVQLNYAGQYASVANYWKNRQGTIDAVYQNGTISAKQALENEFRNWAYQPGNEKYSGVLTALNSYYKQVEDRNVERMYNAQIQMNVKYISIAYRLGTLLDSYAKQELQNRIKMKPELLKTIDEFYKEFDEQLEGEMLNSMVRLYQENITSSLANEALTSQDASSLSLKAHSSIFANKASVLAFMQNPDRLKLDADPMYQLGRKFIEGQKAIAEAYAKVDAYFAKNNRLYLQGLRKAFPNKEFYPDANGTMRITFGKVSTLPKRKDRDYEGIDENYYTLMDGLVKKYKAGDEEFDLPRKVLDMNALKDFGVYADKNGHLPVNFLSDNDITGGNSGSPTIDGEGNLIGIAFDGNSEALSGDIVFEKEYQKTINVDIRFVMWIIDKYAGARNLIEEMTFVTHDAPKPIKGSELNKKK